MNESGSDLLSRRFCLKMGLSRFNPICHHFPGGRAECGKKSSKPLSSHPSTPRCRCRWKWPWLEPCWTRSAERPSGGTPQRRRSSCSSERVWAYRSRRTCRALSRCPEGAPESWCWRCLWSLQSLTGQWSPQRRWTSGRYSSARSWSWRSLNWSSAKRMKNLCNQYAKHHSELGIHQRLESWVAKRFRFHEIIFLKCHKMHLRVSLYLRWSDPGHEAPTGCLEGWPGLVGRVWVFPLDWEHPVDVHEEVEAEVGAVNDDSLPGQLDQTQLSEGQLGQIFWLLFWNVWCRGAWGVTWHASGCQRHQAFVSTWAGVEAEKGNRSGQKNHWQLCQLGL